MKKLIEKVFQSTSLIILSYAQEGEEKVTKNNSPQ